MDRLDWMYLRALVPSGVVLAFSLALAWVLKDIGASPLLSGLAAVPRWLVLGGVILASVVALGPLYRFWLWHRGEGLMCPDCSGPLGDRIDGRYGPYYKCLCCSGNVAARRVE
ncbi:hypothetical protein [Pseudoxanthomonas winnipegensis]|uniref:hypothetical protein n=1 Tax=Pseudoxanthomonas winnipegensis TaxID=2480810 RepID=UPI0030F48A2D